MVFCRAVHPLSCWGSSPLWVWGGPWSYTELCISLVTAGDISSGLGGAPPPFCGGCPPLWGWDTHRSPMKDCKCPLYHRGFAPFLGYYWPLTIPPNRVPGGHPFSRAGRTLLLYRTSYPHTAGGSPSPWGGEVVGALWGSSALPGYFGAGGGSVTPPSRITGDLGPICDRPLRYWGAAWSLA